MPESARAAAPTRLAAPPQALHDMMRGAQNRNGVVADMPIQGEFEFEFQI
jgi:hypothetical protein